MKKTLLTLALMLGLASPLNAGDTNSVPYIGGVGRKDLRELQRMNLPIDVKSLPKTIEVRPRTKKETQILATYPPNAKIQIHYMRDINCDDKLDYLYSVVERGKTNEFVHYNDGNDNFGKAVKIK